jgi:hypothetical protein
VARLIEEARGCVEDDLQEEGILDAKWKVQFEDRV